MSNATFTIGLAPAPVLAEPELVEVDAAPVAVPVIIAVLMPLDIVLMPLAIEPALLVDDALVPFMAMAWNSVKVLPVVGALIANTIPLAQWPTWLQKAQMGLVSLTISEKTGTTSFFTGMNPDEKPVMFDMTVLIGSHGEAKADCTTEWFFDMNWNCTTSPGWAWILSGEKVRVLLSPTLTTCTVTSLLDWATAAVARSKVETTALMSCMMTDI